MRTAIGLVGGSAPARFGHVMAEVQPCWASLPGSLLDCIFTHLDSDSLASCCAVCHIWHALLCGAGSSGEPWAAALHREYG